MFVAFCGLVITAIGAFSEYNPLVIVGFGAMTFDAINEIANIGHKLVAVGNAITQTLGAVITAIKEDSK